MVYGRQVDFGEDPNRWNFKSDRDFRTLAAAVYQSEVWACTPTNWYLKKKGCLTVECDEMWSFVGLKRNKQWIWLAPDSDSRKIVGMHVGSRDRAGAEALWKSLPPDWKVQPYIKTANFSISKKNAIDNHLIQKIFFRT